MIRERFVMDIFKAGKKMASERGTARFSQAEKKICVTESTRSPEYGFISPFQSIGWYNSIRVTPPRGHRSSTNFEMIDHSVIPCDGHRSSNFLQRCHLLLSQPAVLKE